MSGFTGFGLPGVTTVTLQFSRPDFAHEGFMDRMISEGICKETRSEICHVDLVTPYGTLIGAHIKDGVQERKPDYEYWGLRLRVGLLVPDEKAEALYTYAHAAIGTPYDAKDILGIALGDARLHADGRVICSGFMAVALHEKTGILVIDKDLWQTSPEELRLICASQAGATRQRIEG